MSLSHPILVAIPNEWSPFVCEHLEKLGFSVMATYSKDETLEVLQKQKEFECVIIVSDWAMSTQDNDTDGIISLVRGKIPTVTIITETSRHQSGYQYMKEVFFSPNHEYVTSPFGVDEVVMRMKNMGIAL
ncbi:MAG: hypothetical protein U0V18_15390 [Anaerolineales bacterium]